MAADSPRDRPQYGSGREALLDAAITVVARRGLRYLTYRSVAAEPGVTHRLVAHHFGSRDALLMATLRHSVHRSIDVTALRTEGGTPDDFVRGFAEMIERDPTCTRSSTRCCSSHRRSPEARRHAE